MTQATFRIAIRHEGQFINAYLATMDTMEGAKLVASIDHELCVLDPQIFELFKDAMLRAMPAVVGLIGHKIDRIEIRDAPAHERAGHA